MNEYNTRTLETIDSLLLALSVCSAWSDDDRLLMGSCVKNNVSAQGPGENECIFNMLACENL